MDPRRVEERRLKAEIVRRGIWQHNVARQLGIDSSTFNLYLNGRRTPPEGLEERVTAALERLEAAERAADEARARVLSGGAA